MSSRKETKLLFESWRSYLKEAEQLELPGLGGSEMNPPSEEPASAPTAKAPKDRAASAAPGSIEIRVFDYDGTLVQFDPAEKEKCFQYVVANQSPEDKEVAAATGKYNVSTNDKKSLRSEAQIKTGDFAYYAAFFEKRGTLSMKTLPLAESIFKEHMSSPHTYILSRLRINEKEADDTAKKIAKLNTENLVYQFLRGEEHKRSSEEKLKESVEKPLTSLEAMTDSKRNAISRNLWKFSKSKIIICEYKQQGTEDILSKYPNKEAIKNYFIYDTSPEDLKDQVPTARAALGDRVEANPKF